MGDALAPAPRSSFARYWTAAAISSFGSALIGDRATLIGVITAFAAAALTAALSPLREAPNRN
jgi:hypothetical protein